MIGLHNHRKAPGAGTLRRIKPAWRFAAVEMRY
jgi:hypothetical protein